MSKSLLNLCLVLVLISNRYYVNTDRIDYIDVKKKWIKVGQDCGWNDWQLYVTDEDIETLKRAMGTFGK